MRVSIFAVAGRLLVREKILAVAVWVFAAMLVATLGAAQFSGRQPATVGLDVGLSVIRLLLPVIVVLMALILFSREIERRHFLNSLTYPVSRAEFFLVRFAALFSFVVVLLLVAALLLAGVVWYCGIDYEQGTPVNLGGAYALTVAFIALDLLVVSAVASLLALFASTAGFVLVGTLGFVLVARSYALTISLLNRNAALVADADSYGTGVSFLGLLLPDLGGLDIRTIAIYGNMEFLPHDWLWTVFCALVYVFVLLALGVFLLQRKRFS
ncbi:MAG: ABC transporter permease [Pseudomonas sp.]|nr:ABC transporter permease [Pseudomonas sp.]